MLRLAVVMRSLYGGDELSFEFLTSTLTDDIIWANFCKTCDNAVCIEYMKKFWYIDHYEMLAVCSGCRDSVANQLGHMDFDGCLSEYGSDPDTVDKENEKLIKLFKV
jgi:hypothetical protein